MIPLLDIGLALLILAAFALFGVYFITETSEHAERMRLDDLWDDDVSERERDINARQRPLASGHKECRKDARVTRSRSLTSSKSGTYPRPVESLLDDEDYAVLAMDADADTPQLQANPKDRQTLGVSTPSRRWRDG